MHLMYFTEQPMSAYPVEEAKRGGNITSLMFSNKHYDPVAASRLYNGYIDDYVLAEESGFDGIMLNEHHNGPFCMQAKANIMASVLAAKTKRVKIVILGNPLPLSENPVRLAEELAMIDLISKGRLVSGFVRGAGVEQLATSVNPTYNRERFEEAHDLIIRTWTERGPFRWEGAHYQNRVVNPWALPLQQPHPRIWIPGVVSTETVLWSARHRYPYIALNTTVEATKKIWETYDNAAADTGYNSGPEQHGYLLRCHVAETDEKALENARNFMWMQGEFIGVGHPVWANPTGYYSPSMRKTFVQIVAGRMPPYVPNSYETQLENLEIIAGSPKTVIAKLRKLISETRPGIMSFWANDGFISHSDAQTCIRLLGQDVLPAVREMGKEFGLNSPFDLNTPVSLDFSTDLKKKAG